MAHYNQDWENLGRNIADIVDRAVNSHDYQKLDQTIRQVIDRAVDVGGEALRKAADSASRSAQKTAGPAVQEAKRPVVVEQRNLPALYGKTNRFTAVGIVKTVGGALLSAFTFLALLSSAAVKLVVGSSLLTVPMGLGVAAFGGGVALLCSGVGNLERIGRFRTYRKTLGDKTQCTLEKLARSVGKSVKFVRREVGRMIDQGLFLEGHLDKEETMLITSNETYRHFEHSRLQLEERQRLEAAARTQETARVKEAAARRAPQVQEVLDRGNAFIAQIRKCNDDIPGVEISEKISRMELIVRRIFQRVETHPEIVPDLKKLMDYYLPMTVKLLNAYADMDAQPVQGATIQASKREIEATLDTLNLAFEKLLDDLFADTAMDVSSDISVLNTLLAQEGLTEDDLTRMKKKNEFAGTGE